MLGPAGRAEGEAVFVAYVVLGAFTLDILNMVNDVYPKRLLMTAQNLVFEALLSRNMSSMYFLTVKNRASYI
jgi:hypothetical protein